MRLDDTVRLVRDNVSSPRNLIRPCGIKQHSSRRRRECQPRLLQEFGLSEPTTNCQHLIFGFFSLKKGYFKQLFKFVAELLAIAITVVLLQIFINRVGFESAWPILVVILAGLVIVISAMRKH